MAIASEGATKVHADPTETGAAVTRAKQTHRLYGQRGRLGVTALIALTFYGYTWLVQPARPQVGAVFDEPPKLVNVLETGFSKTDAGTPLALYQSRRWGWYGAWYDQFHYARMARAIGRFELPGIGWDHTNHVQKNPNDPHEIASFNYGLGYPAIGGLFFALGFKGDPFVVPDGLLFALSAMLALILAERVLSPWTALIVVNALVLTGPFALYFVIPYGTSLTVVAVLLGLVLVTGTRADWKIGIAFGVASAFAFAARYTDVIFVLALLAIFVVMRRKESWRVMAATAVSLTIAAAITAWAQQRVFGNAFTTPYKFHHNGLDASLRAYDLGAIPNAGVGVFLTGDRSKLFRVEPILKAFPWVALAPFGLWLLFRRRDRLRWPLLAASAVGIVSSLSYLAWVFGGTRDLEIWIIRFHTPWFPLWAVLSGVVIERAFTALGASGPRATTTEEVST